MPGQADLIRAGCRHVGMDLDAALAQHLPDLELTALNIERKS